MTLRHISINGSHGLFEFKDGSIMNQQERPERASSVQASIATPPMRATTGTARGVLTEKIA